MVVRLLGIILVCAAWGCESLSMTHQSSEALTSGPPPVTLASLSTSEIQGSSSLSQRMSIPQATKNGVSQGSGPIDPFPTVYFPFDSWEISSDVQDRLDATASWMNRFPNYGLTIEGHTDVRGTESYNMILGVRRAKAVKEYLTNLGISRKRLDVVSFGNTLVLCEVDDEHQCHQFNRRADLMLE
ncbi:MAG: OmpA family protein [Nitrospirota bacterium]|nr:OmpA family protein [Nitrospirota bacterium]